MLQRGAKPLAGLTGLRPRQLAVAALVAIVALIAYVYASTNPLSTAEAAEGASGMLFTVSNVHYLMNEAAPDRIDAATFELSAPSAPLPRLSIQINSGGPSYSCSAAATGVSCATTSPPATLESATALIVTASAPTP